MPSSPQRTTGADLVATNLLQVLPDSPAMNSRFSSRTETPDSTHPSDSSSEPEITTQEPSKDRVELTVEMRSKIRALYHLAHWPFRKIASITGVSLTTVYRVAKPPITPQRNRVRGRPFLLRSPQRKQLIATATASAENR